MVPDGSATTVPAVVIAGAAPGAIYVCVTELAGQTQQRAIELAPEVAKLCRKAGNGSRHTGATCRRRGGRVFTVDGTEITLQTEAEYDRRVMRVRMKSN
jgi:hypothetical protein